jgi:hypothetical protein
MHHLEPWASCFLLRPCSPPAMPSPWALLWVVVGVVPWSLLALWVWRIVKRSGDG